MNNIGKSIKQFNNIGEHHGYWEVYWSNGFLAYKSFYQNDKEVGYEEIYYNSDGKLSKKKYYL